MNSIGLTILIITLFILLFMVNIIIIGTSNIKKNWPEYRCNPAVMPLAGFFGVDPSENFVYCVQNMQTGLMGYLLQPTNYSLSVINSLGGELTADVNAARKMMSNIRDFVSNIVENVFGVILNVVIEFQKIMMGIKDVTGKFVGIMASLMYLLDGTTKTMESAWAGPPGEMTRALCFSGNTAVKLKDGTIKCMKDIALGDVLKNESVVEGTLILKNWDKRERFYSMPNGENGEHILVTGKHLIFKRNMELDFVKNHPDAVKLDQSDDILYCLITSDHLINIGEYFFWDWEDTPEMIKDLK